MCRLAIFVAFLFVGWSGANAQWDIEQSHTTASLRGIHNVGAGVAWASGTNGTVLRTEDGDQLRRLSDSASRSDFMTCGLAQTPTESQPGNLELRLEPESVQKNIPKAFTVLIVNKSDHEVRLPMPSFEWGDVPHGTVWLRLNFVPLKRGALPEQAGGIKDFFYQPILERVKGWKVLGPGESLNLATISDRIPAQDAGSYDYWAYYYPPGMTKGDEEVLQKAGIDYPKKELESAHVKFVKKR